MPAKSDQFGNGGPRYLYADGRDQWEASSEAQHGELDTPNLIVNDAAVGRTFSGGGRGICIQGKGFFAIKGSELEKLCGFIPEILSPRLLDAHCRWRDLGMGTKSHWIPSLRVDQIWHGKSHGVQWGPIVLFSLLLT